MRAVTELRVLGKRRGRLQVVRDILMVALDGANTTRIVYGANLTFTRFKKYSACLVVEGLLAVDGNPGPLGYKVYRTSEKGRRLLGLLTEAIELV